MNLHALKKHIWAALLVATLPLGSLYADKIWNGVVGAGLNAFNENVNVTGHVQFNSAHVEMRADDGFPHFFNVTVQAILSQNIPGAMLDFIADNGSIIYVNVDNNLTFAGSGVAGSFIVTVSGSGSVVFKLADDTEVSLTDGTYLFSIMDGVSHDNVVVVRNNQASNADCSFVVGENSLLGFAAQNGAHTGRISFVPSNNMANTGRLKLVVNDGGSVAVQGYAFNPSVPVVPADFVLTELRGQSAEFAIASSDMALWSGLLVVNNNTVFPLLRTNPWYVDPAPAVAHQPGFILGQNGILNVATDSYLDYVAAYANMNPAPAIDNDIMSKFEVNGSIPPVNTLVKQRNASALIVDSGSKDNFAVAYPRLMVGEGAKVYFLSAVDFDGPSVNADFTVNPTRQYTGQAGYGSIVFDVEGRLDVLGGGLSAINILSLKEANVGGSVLIEFPGTHFKLRMYEKVTVDDVEYYKQYGKACALINGRINLNNIALQHTDSIHQVYEKNITAESEPTYIGGESFYLGGSIHRPTVALYDSKILVHTDMALSGVDILVPDADASNNVSETIFYQNGYVKDQGTGRNLILGTNVGSTAQDLGTIVDRAAHFDVRQENEQAAETDIRMELLSAPNNDEIVEGVPAGIESQYSVHSIYLAHSTNISLGIFGAEGVDPLTGHPFVPLSTGTLRIGGHFFSFESQGGYLGAPSRSIQIGQGGIFADNHGRIELSDAHPRVNMNAMIGLSYNGAAYLPSQFITYDKNIGISNSALDLSVAAQRQIVGPGSHVSDYTLDWKYIKRDPTFIPYNPPSTPAAGAQEAPIAANLATIPTIYAGAGEFARVDQFQIANSRLGDSAHLMINGGKVRELILQNGKESGTVPTAVVALKGDGELGIGAAFTSPDSLEAAVVLGNNGLTIIADGDCQIYLNQDVVVDGVCHLLPGPEFGPGNRLEITSGTAKEFRIKRGGVLDLSLFNQLGEAVVFGGNVHVIFEPGSRLILGNDSQSSQASLIFTDDAQVIFEKYVDSRFDLVDVLVKINGRGNIIFDEDAMLDIPRDAFVAIESGGDENIGYITDLNIQMYDAANFYIGSDEDFGGSLQIGNRQDYSAHDGSVSVNFTINGINSKLQIGSQGFLGLGAGIVSKPNGAPDTWSIESLRNVANITANLTQGVIEHNEIFAGSNVDASLIAIGDAAVLSLANFPAVAEDIIIRGGGNMYLVAGSVEEVNPVVGSTDSSIVGILSSRDTLRDRSKLAAGAPATTPAAQFAYFKANPYQEQSAKYAQLSQNSLGTLRLGYIDDTRIMREDKPFLIGYSATNADPRRSLDQGTVIIAQDEVGTTSVSAFAVYM